MSRYLKERNTPDPRRKRPKSTGRQGNLACGPDGEDATPRGGGGTSVGQNLRERRMYARTNQLKHRGASRIAAPGEQRVALLRTALGTNGDQTSVRVRESILQGVRADPDHPGHRMHRARLGSGEGLIEQIFSSSA